MINKIPFKKYFFVNKFQTPQKHLIKSSPLFKLREEEHIQVVQKLASDTNSGPNDILKDSYLSKLYTSFAPYQVLAGLVSNQVSLVLNAKYLYELKTLEFDLMDISGLHKCFIDLEYFVPVTYNDFTDEFGLNLVCPTMVDIDLIFKHSKMSHYFLFYKYGQWINDTANHEDFNIKNCFKENEWIDEQIPNNLN